MTKRKGRRNKDQTCSDKNISNITTRREGNESRNLSLMSSKKKSSETVVASTKSTSGRSNIQNDSKFLPAMAAVVGVAVVLLSATFSLGKSKGLLIKILEGFFSVRGHQSYVQNTHENKATVEDLLDNDDATQFQEVDYLSQEKLEVIKSNHKANVLTSTSTRDMKSVSSKSLNTPNAFVSKNEVLSSLSTAMEAKDTNTIQALVGHVLKFSDPYLFWNVSEQLLSITAAMPQISNLRILLLQNAYDLILTRTESYLINTDLTDHRDYDYGIIETRRFTYLLGLAHEANGNIEKAQQLYFNATKQGLWSLPDQRPQHYFPYLPNGPPFPATKTYSGPVEFLEKYFSVIYRELVAHKVFPGQLSEDNEKLAVSGRWLQASFLHHNTWNEQHMKLFPITTQILQTIASRDAYDLPEVIFQMSTLQPGTIVHPHCGSGNHKVRLHLPLYHVPEDCGIQIANETQRWEMGKVLVIDDSYVHHVWNNSTNPRTVLIVDVWKSGLTEQDKNDVRKYFHQRDLNSERSG